MYGDVSRPSYCTGYQSNALFFSKTGSIALRLADVQPPKVVATLSTEISFCAFSANVGQSDAPSSTTGTTFLPMTPPAALISSIAMSSEFLTVTSLMAIVPDSECRMPTLISPPVSPLDAALVALLSPAAVVDDDLSSVLLPQAPASSAADSRTASAPKRRLESLRTNVPPMVSETGRTLRTDCVAMRSGR